MLRTPTRRYRGGLIAAVLAAAAISVPTASASTAPLSTDPRLGTTISSFDQTQLNVNFFPRTG